MEVSIWRRLFCPLAKKQWLRLGRKTGGRVKKKREKGKKKKKKVLLIRPKEQRNKG